MLSICELQNFVNKVVRITNKETGEYWSDYIVYYFEIHQDDIICCTYKGNCFNIEVSLNKFDISLQD